MTTEIESNGKLGKVFLERDEIEGETYKQIKHMIGLDAIQNARVMPDCHKSKNCCVGFTSQLIDKIVPNFVGIDIGCGIVSYPLTIDRKMLDWRDKKLWRFTEEIHNEIHNPENFTLDGEFLWGNQILRIFDLANQDIIQFARYYHRTLGINIKDSLPDLNEPWLHSFLNKINSNTGEIEKAIGTLGGGNHFIELERSDSSGQEYITVHSGSRIIGKKICEYHQKKIHKQNEIDWNHFDEEVEKFNKANKNKEKRRSFRDKLRKEIKIKNKKMYLDEKDAIEYYIDMIFGQKFALVNREVLLTKVLQKLNLPFDPRIKIESIHNYIDFEDFILRKGAIRAAKGKPCVIALNMTDGILLCEGKGNEDWNYSSAHGSGREITRQKALKNSHTISKRLAKQLAKNNVITVSPLIGIVDEAPECYKSTNFIKNKIIDSVIVKEQLKPFINIKHSE